MTHSDAELMRSWLHVVNSPEPTHTEQVQEAFPILKQAIARELYNLAGKLSSHMQGHAVIKTALVPYMKSFTRNMGMKGKNWDTVTWKEVLSFLISKASLNLPLGEFEPQTLTGAEVTQTLNDRRNRAVIASFLGKDRAKLSQLMPLNVHNTPALRVGGRTPQTADLAQKLITGVFTVMIRTMIEKAEGRFELPAQTQAPQPQAPTASQPAAPASAQTSAPAATPSQPQSPPSTPAQLSTTDLANLKALLGIK